MELKNFDEFGDEGEIWFGRGTEQRMLSYVVEKRQLSRNSRITDFGCGNGSMLRALVSSGFCEWCPQTNNSFMLFFENGFASEKLGRQNNQFQLLTTVHTSGKSIIKFRRLDAFPYPTSLMVVSNGIDRTLDDTRGWFKGWTIKGRRLSQMSWALLSWALLSVTTPRLHRTVESA